MTVLLEQIAALYRDPLDIDAEAGELPAPSIEQLETTLIWALRDGDDDFAAVLFAEIRRLRDAHSEAVLIGSSAGIWRMH